jgi:hypothetical protein
MRRCVIPEWLDEPHVIHSNDATEHEAERADVVDAIRFTPTDCATKGPSAFPSPVPQN